MKGYKNGPLQMQAVAYGYEEGYSSHALERRFKTDPTGILRMKNWPRWHDKLYHSRLIRRRTKELAACVVKGVYSESMNWPDGRKPHRGIATLLAPLDGFCLPL